MDKRIGWGTVCALIATVAVIVSALLILTPVKAGAVSTDVPYGGCKESVQVLDSPAMAHSEAARYCRHHGWIIREHVVVNPFGRAWTNLPRCENEDATTFSCYWDALRQGNHAGRGFIALPGRTVYVDKINGRFVTSKKYRDGFYSVLPYGV